MSETYHLCCVTCHESIWIGRGRDSEEKKTCIDCYEKYRYRYRSPFSPTEVDRITSLRVYHL